MKNSNTSAALDPANLTDSTIEIAPVIDQDKEQVIEKKATFWLSFLSAVVTVARAAVSIFSKK
jgi:hypothetical protein